MRYALIVTIMTLMLGGTTWAASEKELALNAAISMEDAIKAAIATVPGGKPYEVELSKRKGQAAYKVEIVDASKKTHKVFVDAQNGKIIAE